jgi:4-amino-4-deoxy-L-arabinose transferase-like glycosyltransferase
MTSHRADPMGAARDAQAGGRLGSFGWTVLIVGALTAVRLAGLKVSAVDLFYDEAQYWSWSRDLAFGYYSKPPLLAWVIAAAEQVCGGSEWCVRAPSPLFYFATSLVVYAAGRTFFDARAGFWAALLTAFGTGTAFSARIISTDVPLVFFWAVALLAYGKLLTGGGRVLWTFVLGVAVGLGLLAKYAMIYFIPGLLLAAFLSERARAALKKPDVWIALALGALIVAPNIAWNLSHGLVTFKHTGSLVIGEEARPSIWRGLEFLAYQFAVFGPVVFAVMIFTTLRLTALDVIEQDRVLIALALPPLAIVTGFAVAVHAYANWAAPAFVSGVVLAAATLARRDARFWLWASIVLGVMVQAVLIYGDAVATRIAPPFLKTNPYYRTLGWRAYGEAAGRLARQVGAPTIANDSRGELAALLYYWRDRPEQIVSWRTADIPNFDLGKPLTPSAREPILFVTACPDAERLRPFYAQIEPLGPTTVPAGVDGWRGFYAFKLSGNRGTVGVLPVCGRG